MSRYQHLLIAADFDGSSKRALEVSAEWAKRLGGRRIDLAHVVTTADYGVRYPGTLSEVERRLCGDAEAELSRLRSAHFPGIDGDVTARSDISAGLAIADIATERNVDLCVVGTHGRTGMKRMMMGSVAERVARRTPCDVLIIPQEQEKDTHVGRNILFASDFSPASELAGDTAAALVDLFDSPLHMLHVVNPTQGVLPGSKDLYPESEETRRQMVDRLDTLRAQKFAGDDRVVTEVVIDRSPAAAICRYAERESIDLIVVGTHGRTGLARLLIGSVAERVVRHAPCAILVVRQR
jgi:nucleotide-binding universal stress UspA family protein